MSAPPQSQSNALPCFVQIGFAGSRKLFDLPSGTEDQRPRLHKQVEDWLADKLKALRGELQLQPHQRLCGVSQIAIGADTIFTRVCERQRIPQRIFLPQPRDVYLSAVASPKETDPTAQKQPDFTAEEQSEAKTLLASTHIIQERVVSDADDRSLRFEDCNREILRESDVVICLLRADAGTGKRGGTNSFITLATSRGVKVLKISVELKNGEAEMSPEWLNENHFSAPSLPTSIQHLTVDLTSNSLPSVSQFCAVVKNHVSHQAKHYNKLFSKAALTIIATHVLATLCATVALAGHGAGAADAASSSHVVWWIIGLLSMELLLLLCGFGTHFWLHHTKPQEIWAISRLLAEINRSIQSLGNFHVFPAYLSRLRLPSDLQPLLRTITILHLRSTRPYAHGTLEELRKAYLENRLTDQNPEKGQMAFFKTRCVTEQRWLRWSNRIFVIGSSLAILSTGAKLMLLLGVFPLSGEWENACIRTLGSLAILLPTFAVGALSWATAKEFKARVQTFEAMHQFLETQKTRIDLATSLREFQQLVEETEFNLLGEVAEWYSRRTVSGIA